MDSKKKILIVDDEPDIVTTMKFSLELHGYQVETAYDGEEGLQKAAECMPDLIILDILMPKMFGDDVALTLSKMPETKDIPILFLSNVPSSFISGASDPKNIETKLQYDSHGNMYLAKTCSEEDLLLAIEKQIRGRS